MKTKPVLAGTMCPKRLAGHLAACARRLLPLLLCTVPAAVQAQFEYSTKGRTVSITRYTGPGGAVTIPDTINGLPVTSIGNLAFHCRTSLAEVMIPNGVTNIGNGVFHGCSSLTSVAIPNSVTRIGPWAFSGCTGLTAIAVDALNSSYASLDGVLFDKSRATLIQCPGGKTGVYTIPDRVTGIAEGAFSGCTGLTAITVDALNSSYTTLDGVLFDKNLNTVIRCPEGKAGTYTIPDRVTSIGPEAFHGCSGLTSVAIPNSVTRIEWGAFSHCTRLVSVTIPEGVTGIHGTCRCFLSVTGVPRWGVFAGCTALRAVHFEGDAPSLNHNGAFEGAGKATVYYSPGATGWGHTFDGRPTALSESAQFR